MTNVPAKTTQAPAEALVDSAMLANVLDRYHQNPRVKAFSLGKSVSGNDIPMVVVLLQQPYYLEVVL
jgi:hypothetical protein